MSSHFYLFLFNVGVLVIVDGYMNCAMEQVEEYNEHSKLVRTYGYIVIRGNNGLFLFVPFFPGLNSFFL
jgi:hypothetical protein